MSSIFSDFLQIFIFSFYKNFLKGAKNEILLGVESVFHVVDEKNRSIESGGKRGDSKGNAIGFIFFRLGL